MPGVSIGISAAAARGAVESFILVIFGASGDLTRRKLVPAMFNLYCDQLLPPKTMIVGFARTPQGDNGFRDELRAGVREFAKEHAQDEEKWKQFASRIHYLQGDYQQPDDFVRLRETLQRLARQEQIPPNFLFYLSIPPVQFASTVRQLGAVNLARYQEHAGEGPGRTERGGAPWSRLVVEKPFGRDLDSARELNAQIRQVFHERQIFRIDHYLGKETVQNLLVLRFANSLFEPIWNQKYVDHVQLTVAEDMGVGRRGKYYDNTGALRDMVQNHMMNLLCLVAMEPPHSLDADAIRDEKVDLLHALRPIPADCAAYGVVRAQYTAGEAGGKRVGGYLQEEGVAADSRTETYVAFKTFIDNWRWSGVPFYMRTGKRLPEKLSEISIHFKPVPQVLFNAPPLGPTQPNVLVVRIQPDEGISIQFQVKAPGPAMQIHPYQMDFSYARAFGGGPPEAYERLLFDAALGDSTLFIRSDEIEAAWAFVTPILQGCDLVRRAALPTYPAGTWGPREADDLIAVEGNRWYVSRKPSVPAPAAVHT